MDSLHRGGPVAATLGTLQEVAQVLLQILAIVGHTLSVQSRSAVAAYPPIGLPHPQFIKVMTERRQRGCLRISSPFPLCAFGALRRSSGAVAPPRPLFRHFLLSGCPLRYSQAPPSG